MEGFPPAVYAPRKAGVLRIAVLQEGGEDRAPLAVEFETPDFLVLNMAEAAAAQALAAIRHSTAVSETYGLQGQAFDEGQMPGLARLLTAVETAAHLWRDWNFAERDPGTGEAIVQALTRPNILRLLEDSGVRALWNAHLEAASPLERDEGNVFAVSPNGSTGEAATTADDASSGATPAPADAQAEPESSAPRSNTPP